MERCCGHLKVEGVGIGERRTELELNKTVKMRGSIFVELTNYADVKDSVFIKQSAK